MNRLFYMAQAFVDKYNSEHNENIRIIPLPENGFNVPYINMDNIHIDRGNVILNAFYHFGTPSLFIYYRLLRGLVDNNSPDDALMVLDLLKQEFRSYKSRFDHLLSKNPEWIPAQIMVIIVHEIAHHVFKRDVEIYDALIREAKTFLKDRPFNMAWDYKPKLSGSYSTINFKDIQEVAPELFDIVIEDDMQNMQFLEELAADKFVFNHFSNALAGCGINQAIACTSALIGSCSFFLEYINRVNKLFFPVIVENKQERIKLNMVETITESINSRIRAIYQDYYINNYFEEESIDKESRELYSTLVGVPLIDFNESLDTDLMKSLQPFQDILNEGCQIEFDMNKMNMVLREIEDFEKNILKLILNELDKKTLIK